MWLKAVKGEIEHNYLFLGETTGNQKRTILVLDGLNDSGKGSIPTVAENYFYSPSDHLIQNDTAFQFLQSSNDHLKVEIVANGITNNMLIANNNSPDSGKYVYRHENYRMHPLKTTPSWEMFFDETNNITTWPRAGTCFTPLYAVTNLNRTLIENDNNAWPELCGQGIKDPDFSLTYDYEGDYYSYLMAKINQLSTKVSDLASSANTYKNWMIAGWVIVAAETGAIVASSIYSYRKNKGLNLFTFKRFDNP
ncbi:hypothetical protein GZ77_21545 [Endozoicomonas montiporae]|uniref:Uncharacterized protein n=1 Tax=Endozoicomonas montiporae TaxID=1027273 RepID=A0A081N3I3_9GAMM|nr:hypothetical protein GZ77_23835 [Endozoicomonas montiporae]KEQ13006.1 hypothetical protein GZ77_21545 [Endozoicomonas montiporae]